MMAYFQIQNKKVGKEWQYDFWVIEGNERTFLNTRVYPRKLTTAETDLFRKELDRLYMERKPIFVTKDEPYATA